MSEPVNPRPLSISPDALANLQNAAAARENPTIANPPAGIIPDAASRYDLGRAMQNSTPTSLDQAAERAAAANAASPDALNNYNPYKNLGVPNPNESSRYYDPANVGSLPESAGPSSLDVPPERGIPLERIGGGAGLAGAIGAGIDLGVGIASGRNIGDSLAHAGSFGTGVALGTAVGDVLGGAVGALIGPEGIPIGIALGGALGGFAGGSIADGIYNFFHPSKADRSPQQPSRPLPNVVAGAPGGLYAIVGTVNSNVLNPFTGKHENSMQGCDARSFTGPINFFTGAGSLIFASDAAGHTQQLGGYGTDAEPAGNSLHLVRLDVPAPDLPVRDPAEKQSPSEQSPIRVPVIPNARPKGAPHPTTQPTLAPMPEIRPRQRPDRPPIANPTATPGQSPTPTTTPGQSPTPTTTPGQSPTPTTTPGQSPYPTPTPYPTTPYPTPTPYPTTPYPTPTPYPTQGNSPDSLWSLIPLLPLAIAPAPGTSGDQQLKLNGQGDPQPPGDGPPIKGPPNSPCKNGCGAALANQLNGMDSKLGALNAGAQDALLAEILAKLAIVDAKLGVQATGGLSGFLGKFRDAFDKLTEWLHLDRLLNIMTFIVTLQNAYFLTDSLKIVTLQMISDGLNVLGFQDKDGNGLNLNKLLDKTIEDMLKKVLGVDTLEGMKKEWKALSRIYQAGSNIIYAFQNIAWSILNSLEIIGSWNAQLGNALKKYGVVGQNAFAWLNPAPNFHNKFFTAVSNALNIVSNIDFVAQSIIQGRQAVDEITKQSTEFQKDFQEATHPTPAEHKPTADAAKKSTAASHSPAPTNADLNKVE